MRSYERRTLVAPSPLMALSVLLAVVALPAQAADSAVVVRTNGAPTVERAGKDQPLRPSDTVAPGEVIVTDASSKVKLLLADDSVLAIGPGSRIVLDELQLSAESRATKLRVLAGRFKIAIAKFFGKASAYEIRTPTAVAGVRGTVLWGDTTLDAVCALDGHVEVRALSGNGAPAQLTAGECVNQMADGKTTPLKPSAAELAAYLKEVTLD